MKILTKWLRALLPGLPVDDAQLAEDLTLRGIAVEGVYDLGVGNGSLYEMDITTNRVDAMNHRGVAREAAAIYGLALPKLNYALPEAKAGAAFPVAIEAEDLCGRFTARVLRGVQVGESKDWFAGAEVATYFDLLAQKKISSAVDATNFAWLLMGQPTHAFDLDKIEGGIVVRRARKGEKLKTLDGVERTLDAEDLIVADHAKPLGLAGVMGGWDTMITPETKNVLVEAAWFDPMAVRRTARRHGLHTDASHRFERGADFNAALVASAIVTSILLANGGHIEGEFVDVRVPAVEARTANRRPIVLALSEVRRILGTTVDAEGITAETVEKVLGALGCRLASQQVSESASQRDAAAWQVTLPSWRLDIEREIDLIEEVARVYGYNRFANTLPSFGEGVTALPWAAAESMVRSTLRAAGFHEAIGSTFCSAVAAALTAPQPGLVVPMGNPLSEEAGVLRPSLVPGMLSMIAGNLHRDVSDVRLFELGTVFSGTTEKVEERPTLALVRRVRCRSSPRCIRRVPLNFTTSRALWSRCSRALRWIRFTLTASQRRLGLRPRGSIPIARRGLPLRASRWAGSGSCIQRKLLRASSRMRCWWAKFTSTGFTSCLFASLWRGMSRASSRCGATFLLFWTRVSRGRRSMPPFLRSAFPNWSNGVRASSSRTRKWTPGWAQIGTRCCWA
jgi:phenylalanyl-tRNA synthetase beta chain